MSYTKEDAANDASSLMDTINDSIRPQDIKGSDRSALRRLLNCALRSIVDVPERTRTCRLHANCDDADKDARAAHWAE